MVRSTILVVTTTLSGNGAWDQLCVAPAGRTFIIKWFELFNNTINARDIQLRLVAPTLTLPVFHRRAAAANASVSVPVWWVVYPEWELQGMQSGSGAGIDVTMFGADLLGAPT